MFVRGQDPKETMIIGIAANSLHTKAMYISGTMQHIAKNSKINYALTEVDTVIDGVPFYRLMLDIKRKGINHPDVIQKIQGEIIRHYKEVYGDHECELMKMIIKFYDIISSNKIDLEDLINKYVVIGKSVIIPIKL